MNSYNVCKEELMYREVVYFSLDLSIPRALGLKLNLPPFTTGRGVNSNRAENATFLGNAFQAVFA